MLLAALLGYTSVMAQSKVALQQSDSTLSMSERKAILGISVLGLESKEFTFPVTFKPLKGYPIPVGTWTVRVSQGYADTILAKEYPMLISNRFDKLIFEEDKASIYTATKDITTSYERIPPFTFEPGSYKIFKAEVQDYLNYELADKMTKVLSASADARYSEMSEQEAASFIQTKAKEVGIPVEMLQRLVSSSYVYAVYLPKITGSLTIALVEKTNFFTGQKYRVFESTFNAPLRTKLLVYKFNGKKFEFYKDVDSDSHGDVMGSLAKSISGSASIERRFRPRARDAQALFDEVFKNSFKDTLIAIGKRLKEDRAFAISAPIARIEGSSATIDIGVQEDIRVDHPLKVFREVDGKEELVGLLKVRQSGKNCQLLPKEERTQTIASVLSGSVEAFDLAVEHPWTGVFGSFGFQKNSGEDLFNGASINSGASRMLQLGFKADLGYVLNSQAMSEVWMNLDIGLGGVDYDTTKMPNYNYTYYPQNGAFGIRAAFGMEKHFYIVKKLYAMAGFDLAEEAHAYSFDSSKSLTVATLSITPRAGIGYNPSINSEWSLSVGYDMPMATSAKFGDSDNSVDVEGFTRSKGLVVRFGYSYQIDFAGPFVKMMAHPSRVCNDMKK